MGVGRRLREHFRELRIVAVEPEESNVLSGCEPGEHGIQGIGDGFIPELLDVNCVDEVLTVSTDDARREADRIRTNFGHCVGVSAGAYFSASRKLRDRVAVVATLWPDCSNRYVSLGLAPPSATDVSCPMQEKCIGKSLHLLGDEKGME